MTSALDPGEQAVVTPQRLGHVNPRLTTVPIGRVAREWNVNVSGAPEAWVGSLAPTVDVCAAADTAVIQSTTRVRLNRTRVS